MRIIGLFPFGPDNFSDKTWHIVLFDKWINTGLEIKNPKWQTYFSVDWADGTAYFQRSWGKPNSCDAGDSLLATPEKIPEWAVVDYHKVFRLPWERICYRYYNLKHGKWVLNTGKTYEEQKEQEKDQDVFETTFHFFENKETGETSPVKETWHPADSTDKSKIKRVVVKAKVTAWRRKYCWRCLPKWLPIFPETVDKIEIELNEDIGKGRGSWKGGTLGLPTDFVGNIRDSWYKFKKEMLPKYLRG